MFPIRYPKGTTNADAISELGANAKGKTILITGVSPGSLGASLAISLAPLAPAQLILFSRKEENLVAGRDEIVKSSPESSNNGRIVLVACDLSSQDSVRRAVVDKVLGNKEVAKIDVVVNCASPMLMPFEKSVEGVEMHWAVNQVGPFALFNLLLNGGKLRRGCRVLNVTSGAYISAAPLEKERTGWQACNWKGGAPYDKWQAYALAKCANIAFSRAINHKFGRDHEIISVAPMPGANATNIGRYMTEDDFKIVSQFKLVLHQPSEDGIVPLLVAVLTHRISPSDGILITEDAAQIETADFVKSRGHDGIAEWLVGPNAVVGGQESWKSLWEFSESLVKL